MTGRFLALHLPSLATDRLRRAEPKLPASRPLATWVAFGNRRLQVAVDAAAEATGLRPGQALADAQALQALALWARRYTPLTPDRSPHRDSCGPSQNDSALPCATTI